jgi:G:T-mismatch repair DNA endonuclease (very short patch repair protein)
MKNSEKLIQEKYNGNHPTCKCGCGENTIYDPGRKDFPEYKRGHQTRVIKNYFGDPKNPKRVEKIISTRKQKFNSGEYNHIKKQVSKPRSEEVKNKISKSGKGVSRPKPEGFGIGRKQSKNTRKKMSDSAIQRIIKTDQNHTSKLEKTFANILELLDIEYKQFFYAKDIKAFYDFYLPKFNILIEVDGDFWHCNPNTKYSTPKYETQNKNIKRDKQKNQWAQDNNYKILRFWEDDINNNIQQIKQILLENCK